jgi:hypothetical protein
MKFECLWWRHARRFWHMSLRRLTREAAEDLMDGIDSGDHAVLLPPRRIRPPGRRGPPIKPPACPGLATLEDLERMDREFLAGGPVTDAVVRGVVRDLRRPPQN